MYAIMPKSVRQSATYNDHISKVMEEHRMLSENYFVKVADYKTPTSSCVIETFFKKGLPPVSLVIDYRAFTVSRYVLSEQK